jgi:hypothetical protein
MGLNEEWRWSSFYKDRKPYVPGNPMISSYSTKPPTFSEMNFWFSLGLKVVFIPFLSWYAFKGKNNSFPFFFFFFLFFKCGSTGARTAFLPVKYEARNAARLAYALRT